MGGRGRAAGILILIMTELLVGYIAVSCEYSYINVLDERPLPTNGSSAQLHGPRDLHLRSSILVRGRSSRDFGRCGRRQGVWCLDVQQVIWRLLRVD